jgi:hypothetical protein
MRAIRCCTILVIFLSFFAALTPASTNHPKILIIYDMEGVSGVTHYEMLWFQRPDEYAKGRESLTSDVNAAIRGLTAGGAGSIWVQDGHGSGNANEPDLLVDKMDSHAKFDFRNYDFDPYNTGIDGSVDAIVCIAMHAHANTNGFMAHTVTDRISYKINGVRFYGDAYRGAFRGTLGHSGHHGFRRPGPRRRTEAGFSGDGICRRENGEEPRAGGDFAGRRTGQAN